MLVIGGEEAKEREFPHMALIGFGEGNPEGSNAMNFSSAICPLFSLAFHFNSVDYNCGGSLISEEWILSAGINYSLILCAAPRNPENEFNFPLPPSNSKSRMGPAAHAKLGDVKRGADNANTWTYSIVERIPHPDYTSRLAENDIALFKINEPARLSRYVIPVCLPQAAELATKEAIATGWGRTGLGAAAAELLMKVTLDYAEQSRCDAVYANDAKLKGKPIDWSKMVCAGSTNKTGDTCSVSWELCPMGFN